MEGKYNIITIIIVIIIIVVVILEPLGRTDQIYREM